MVEKNGRDSAFARIGAARRRRERARSDTADFGKTEILNIDIAFFLPVCYNSIGRGCGKNMMRR